MKYDEGQSNTAPGVSQYMLTEQIENYLTGYWLIVMAWIIFRDGLRSAKS